MVSDADLETIEKLKARLGEPDEYDDEEQGLEDAARVLQGLEPRFRDGEGRP